MKRFKRSLGMLLAGTVAAAGAAFIVAPAAQAAPIGTLSISPTSGGAFTPISVTTNTGCTDANATNFLVRISGGSIGATPAIINGNSGLSSISATPQQTTPMTVSLSKVLDQVRSDAGLPSLDPGTYTLEFVCRTALQNASLGEFVGTFNITTAMTAAANGAYVVPGPAADATTTTVAPSVPSPQVSGTSVTFTATVSDTPTPATIPTGSVQFKDGAANLGSPIAVDASGHAAYTTSPVLALGSHDITAVYTHTGNFVDSTSSILTYVISSSPAHATSTSLSVTPTTGAAFQTVAFDATVTDTNASPTTVAGSCNFLDGSTVLGSGAVASGHCLFSLATLAGPGHSFTAVFVPTSNHSPSTSAPVTATYSGVNVCAATGSSCTDPQTVVVTVPTGTLVISTPYTATSPFNLGTLVLNSTATGYDISAPFGAANAAGVTITDTRAGALPFTAQVASTNFINGANSINANLLSFTSVVPTYIATSTGINAATNPVVTTDVPDLSGAPHTFATGHGLGSVYVTGTLGLHNVPTSTQPGLYTATVTFTIA